MKHYGIGYNLIRIVRHVDHPACGMKHIVSKVSAFFSLFFSYDKSDNARSYVYLLKDTWFAHYGQISIFSNHSVYDMFRNTGPAPACVYRHSYGSYNSLILKSYMAE